MRAAASTRTRSTTRSISGRRSCGCRRSRPQTTLRRCAGEAKTFPKTAKKMLDPIPLSAMDAERQAVGRHQAGARPDRRGRHHPGGRPPSGRRAARRVRRGEAARREEDAGQPSDLHRRLQRRGHPPAGRARRLHGALDLHVRRGQGAQIRAGQARAPDRGRGRRPHRAVLGPRPAGLAASDRGLPRRSCGSCSTCSSPRPTSAP